MEFAKKEKKREVELKSVDISSGKKKKKKFRRGHPDLNRGPLDLQSNALPLSYTPNLRVVMYVIVFIERTSG